MKTFELVDAEAWHAEHPDSYWIPPLEVRANLTVGNYAKLDFRYSEREGECMWVEITEVKPRGYVGSLRNHTLYDVDLPYGVRIQFEFRHIIDAVTAGQMKEMQRVLKAKTHSG